MATKVTLRRKKISKGRESLYLDFYPPIPHLESGKLTRREFLGTYLFIVKTELKEEIDKKEEKLKIKIEKKEKSAQALTIPQDAIDKLQEAIDKFQDAVDKLQDIYDKLNPLTLIEKTHNSNTRNIAQSICQQRQNLLNKPEIYSNYEKNQLRIQELNEQCFIEYFKKLTDKRKASNHDNWVSALNYLDHFANGTIKFADLNERFLDDFKDYLLTTKSNRSRKSTLSQNSAVSYFNKVKAALKQAFKDGILQFDLNAKVKPIETVETRRGILTLDELNQLVKTPCNNPLLKRAALFSALTGLRFSDIQKMTWSELEYINERGYFINFRQKKTKGVEVLPISDQAYGFTEGNENPKEMELDNNVFEGLKYSAHQNKHLFQWIGAAGITKDITFHCFRHTYATLQLSGGTDIYTVSKMLGHKDLKTTQIYAKIVDETKRTAANSIQLDI